MESQDIAPTTLRSQTRRGSGFAPVTGRCPPVFVASNPLPSACVGQRQDDTGRDRPGVEVPQPDLLVAYARNWKQANSNPSWLEGHDAAVLQRVHELRQVGEQRSRQCIRGPAALAAKLNDGRLSRRTHREQRSEISIRRHENSTLGGSAIEDRIVVRVLQSY